jgi:hypothetical protein
MEDIFFMNPQICFKSRQLLSQINIPLLDFQTLLVNYEDLSIIDQIHYSSSKTTYKAFYQQKIVLAEVYNFESSGESHNERKEDDNAPFEEDQKVRLMIQLSIMRMLSNDHLIQLIGVGYFQYRSDLPPQVISLSFFVFRLLAASSSSSLIGFSDFRIF